MKRLFRILLLLPVLYLVLIPVYYTSRSSVETVKGIDIKIADTSEYNFVTHKEILNLIAGKSGKITGKPVNEIKISEIEKDLSSLRELRKSEVYLTVGGILNVNADQRVPVMRVIPASGGSYYIDSEGVLMRHRNLYSPRLHIVGGNINISRTMTEGVSVLDTSIKNSILKDIFYLVDYIRKDNFWSAQLDQIYVDGNDEIDLIPRVGNHVIHLGSAEDFRVKLKNLRAFYDHVLPEVGWNRYSNINLAYRDQIVCKRR